MTITYVAAGTAATGNNASVTPGTPAGVTTGDLVLITASIRATAGVVPTPAGWERLNAASNLALFGRFRQAGDTTLPLITFSGGAAGDDTIAQAIAVRGVSPDQLTPAALAAQANVSAQNVAYPALDVPGPAYLVLLAIWKQDDATSLSTSPASYTSIGLTSTTTGNDALQAWWYRIETTEADLGSGSITVTGGGAAVSAALAVALKQAATFVVSLQDEYPPRALLSLTGLQVGDSVALYRLVGGVRTPVRAGSDDAVGDTAFLRVDAEMPFGVPVAYVAVVNDAAEYTSSSVTYSLAGGKVVLSDAVSGTAAEVVILSWPEKTSDAGASVFSAGGRNVVVSTGLGQFTSTLELFVDSTTAADSLDALLATATSGIVLVRQPGGYDDVDGYLAVLTKRKRRWSQDGSDERRVYALDVAEVDGWASELEARGYTLQDLADVYTGLTLQDLADDYASLLLLAQADLQP